MKATTKNTMKMTVLAVMVAVAVMAMCAVAMALPQAEAAKYANLAAKVAPQGVEQVAGLEHAAIVEALAPSDESTGPQPAGADSAVEHPPVAPGDGGDEEIVPSIETSPAPGDEGISEETTTPPSIDTTPSITETRTTETTTPPPARHGGHQGHRHLAYTGGDQMTYLLGGAAIIAAAGALLLISRKKRAARS